MKAGAFTPATPSPLGRDWLAGVPLNEGGGFHPRNPVVTSASVTNRFYDAQ